jgi:gluconate kinase
MANFYFVAGGTGSNKHLIGMALARKYGIPLLYGEMFYNHKQFKMACAGIPFDDEESLIWSHSMVEALNATGGCVVACNQLIGTEHGAWEPCGRISIIHAEASAEELMASWTTEQNAQHMKVKGGQWSFNHTENVGDDIQAMTLSIEAAAAEFERTKDARAAAEAARYARVVEESNAAYERERMAAYYAAMGGNT